MPRPAKIAAHYLSAVHKKCTTVSFQCTEDPDFHNSAQLALKGGGRENFKGLSGMFHKWFVIPGPIIALGGFIAIISTINIFFLIYLAFCIVMNYLLSAAQKKI